MAKGSGSDIYGDQDYALANKISKAALNPKASPTMDINGEQDGRAKGDDLDQSGPQNADRGD